LDLIPINSIDIPLIPTTTLMLLGRDIPVPSPIQISRCKDEPVFEKATIATRPEGISPTISRFMPRIL
jgi:hypothetical protein